MFVQDDTDPRYVPFTMRNRSRLGATTSAPTRRFQRGLPSQMSKTRRCLIGWTKRWQSFRVRSTLYILVSNMCILNDEVFCQPSPPPHTTAVITTSTAIATSTAHHCHHHLPPPPHTTCRSQVATVTAATHHHTPLTRTPPPTCRVDARGSPMPQVPFEESFSPRTRRLPRPRRVSRSGAQSHESSGKVVSPWAARAVDEELGRLRRMYG